MNTHPVSSAQVGSSLRSRNADFFRMDVPRVVNATPARDSKPLRRSLNRLDSMDSWETNENMCTALWELMSRC